MLQRNKNKIRKKFGFLTIYYIHIIYIYKSNITMTGLFNSPPPPREISPGVIRQETTGVCPNRNYVTTQVVVTSIPPIYRVLL